MKKRFGEVKSYEDWCEPALVANVMELLDAEIPKFRGKIETLHLCFTTDPFMYEYPEVQKTSMAILEKVNKVGINCSVLTKGVLPLELSALSKANEYGITLVSLSEDFRQSMEPGAAPLKERLSSLKALHETGCKTWVSIEPYPTPNIIKQDLCEILDAVEFVDKIIFGRTNYSKTISAYKEHQEFYNKQASIVIDFCKEYGKSYHIKDGTITE